MTTHRFSATIGIVGINPYVDVPPAISEALGGRGYIKVVMRIDGHAFPANLVPLGQGRFRLFLNGPMRKAAGKDVGDIAAFDLEADLVPRLTPMRPEFEAALGEAPDARAVFEALPPSGRDEILRYINRLKQPETVERTIARVIRRLRGSAETEGLAFMVGRKPRRAS